MPANRGTLPRRILIGLSTVVVFFILALGALFAYISIYGYRNTATNTDAIVVLGAAVRPADTPTPALAARALLGAKLYKEGLADHLVLTGGLGRFPPAEAEVMRRLAVGENVPESALVIEDKARDTLESARRVAAICRSNNWKSVIVVTDPFHTIRAGWMFRDQGLTVYTAPTKDTYYTTQTRTWYTIREAVGIMAYAVERIVAK